MYDYWDGKWDYSVDGNALTTTLEIGDNFAMNVEIGNWKGVDFGVFILKKLGFCAFELGGTPIRPNPMGCWGVIIMDHVALL